MVRAYVQALDSRDGKRFCELVAPYISGRLDIYLRDRDSEVRAKDCAEFVSAFIGYVEDCGTAREFKAVKLTSVDGVEEHGELRLVHAQVELAQKETCQARKGVLTTPHAEGIWLGRFDGAWRIPKLGEVAHAASLAMPRLPEESEMPGDDRPDEPPDVAAYERAFAALVDDYGRRMDQISVRHPSAPSGT